MFKKTALNFLPPLNFLLHKSYWYTKYILSITNEQEFFLQRKVRRGIFTLEIINGKWGRKKALQWFLFGAVNFYKTVPSSRRGIITHYYTCHVLGEPGFTAFPEGEGEMQTLNWEQPWAGLSLNQVLKAPSSLNLNSSRDRAFTAFLGDLFYCLTTLNIQNFFLIFNLNPTDLV